MAINYFKKLALNASIVPFSENEMVPTSLEALLLLQRTDQQMKDRNDLNTVRNDDLSNLVNLMSIEISYLCISNTNMLWLDNTDYCLSGLSLLQLALSNTLLPRGQEASKYLKLVKDCKINIFISHRWERDNHPDPLGYQRDSIIRWIVYSLFEAIILTNPKLRDNEPLVRPDIPSFHLTEDYTLESLFLEFGAKLSTTNYELACPKACFQGVKTILSSLYPNIGYKGDFICAAIFLALSQIGIWYDYCCMPQLNRNEKEEKYFTSTLKRFNLIQKKMNTLMIWDIKGDCLKRGWCLMESIVAWCNGNPWTYLPYPFTATGGLKVACFQSETKEVCLHGDNLVNFMDGRTIRKQLSIFCKDLMQLKYNMLSDEEIKKWAEYRNIKCTEGDDIIYVTRMMLKVINKKKNRNIISEDWLDRDLKIPDLKLLDNDTKLHYNKEINIFEPDNASDNCRLCNIGFIIFRRKHHCRICGKLVCGGCSKNKAIITGYEKSVRICDICSI